MRCTNCHTENRSGRRFCAECGVPLEIACPTCGHTNEPGEKFCGQCGASLHGAAAGNPAQPASAAPLQSPLSAPSPASIGERRYATVLFSDLSGYTAMNERLDPEEVRAIVGRIKAEAVRIVEGHGGIVNQFVGDEVVALFGIPLAHEDDAVRAVRAARDLHALVRGMSPQVEERIGAPLRLHSGISTGLIVTGTEDRRDGTYGITGDAVNTGARLAAYAAGDSVLVSEETQRGIADFFRIEPLPAVELKGKSGRVTPYRVIEPTGISTRFEAAAQRGFTTYAGREAELAALQAALDRARAGQGQFVTVMGEPGIGKSRLVFEFRHSVPRDQVTVLVGHCQSYGQDTPYLPMVDMLRHGLRLDEATGADALHDHAIAAVRAISPALEHHLPQFLHLLSIQSAEFAIPKELQADALRRAFEEALAAILTENARRQPMVLILEDWHWADESSDSALMHLAGLAPQHPLQVVVTYRPDYERKWANPRNYTPLVLQPLGEADTAAMLRSVWKAERLPEGLAAQVHARTGGNALFNEEVARGLLDDGKVRVENGSTLLAGHLDKLQLPDSVHAVIRARVDRLDPVSREVLRLASVIGREFARPLLDKLHHAPRQIPAALDTLARQDLVHRLRVVPEPAYLFRHALVQDVVYETLLLSRRKRLHEQVGAAIEALYPERIEAHYEALAGHYSKTDNLEKAVEYLEKAGDKAAKLYSREDARGRYRASLDLLDREGGDDAVLRKRIDLSLKWANVSFYNSRPENLHVLEASAKLARKLIDPQRSARISYWIARTHYILGQMNESVREFENCLALAEARNDESGRALALGALGRAHWPIGDFPRAVELLEGSIPLARRGANREELIYSLQFLGASYCALGRFEKGLAIGEEASRLARENGILSMVALTDAGQAYSGVWYGDWNKSMATGFRCRELALQIGDVFTAGSGMLPEGYAAFMAGECSKGISLMRQGASFIESTGSTLMLSGGLARLAECLAIGGDAAQADQLLVRVWDTSRIGERWGESTAHRASALALSLPDAVDSQAVQREIEFSLSRAIERRVMPEAATTRFRYAEILHKTGDLAAALEQLAHAEELFAEMEMTWWRRQAAALHARIEGAQPFVWFTPYVDGPPSLHS